VTLVGCRRLPFFRHLEVPPNKWICLELFYILIRFIMSLSTFFPPPIRPSASLFIKFEFAPFSIPGLTSFQEIVLVGSQSLG